MELSEKISLLQELNNNRIFCVSEFYEILEKCEILKNDYCRYMSTSPVDCDRELLKLPTADFDTCCALITTLLREDYFSNGSFERRQQSGQVKPIIERIILLLSEPDEPALLQFSEKALMALNGYYVYALVDPRTDEVFYIGKGTDNRIFQHEAESKNLPESEKIKLHKIREIEHDGFNVKRIIINWGLTEEQAFAAEASLINLMNFIGKTELANVVSGHHAHECLTTEKFELFYGAEHLKPTDIHHNILVIKINKLYRRDMTEREIYDVVRGSWRASLNTIRRKQIKYVFGVYNQLIVGVYKPDEWHYVRDMIDVPRVDELDEETLMRAADRVYFTCKDYSDLDRDGQFYLHKSIADFKTIQSAQNPITYLPANYDNDG